MLEDTVRRARYNHDLSSSQLSKTKGIQDEDIEVEEDLTHGVAGSRSHSAPHELSWIAVRLLRWDPPTKEVSCDERMASFRFTLAAGFP